MEAALWELVEGDADDEVEVIIRLHQPHQPPPGIRVVTQFGGIVTCRLRRRSILDVRRDERVASMKAPMVVIPGAEPEISAEDLHEPSEESDNRRPRVESATGRGVVVGVIDWGCDFTHPNFRHPDGRTRLLALWDQAGPYAAERPNRYGYGRVHASADLDRALAATRPDAALGYAWHSADPGEQGAHGTHVLDIAAGSGRVGPAGVAPEADLVFVHLASRALPGQAGLGDSVSLLEAVDFILRTAGARPVCINTSMGRQAGSHDGSSLVEQGFDAALTLAPGRFIGQSTGNYYDREAHSSGQLRPGQVLTIPFIVGEADVTPNEVEVWYSGRDAVSVQVRTPAGVLSRKTGLEDEASIRLGDREICRVYHRAREPNNLDNTIHVYLYAGAPAGAWELILTGDDIVDGRFNAWIERDAACRECQARFDRRLAVPMFTTGSIANGFRPVAVGAYDAHDPERRLARFSSSGPTRDGRIKPDLIAPGVMVLAARSSPRAPGERPEYLTRKSGTSMAAPHVTGTVALMFQAAGRPLHIQEMRNLLLTSTRPARVTGDAIHRVGSGHLDTDAAIAAAREYARGAQPRAAQEDFPRAEQEEVAMANAHVLPVAYEEPPAVCADGVEHEPRESAGEPFAEVVPAVSATDLRTRIDEYFALTKHEYTLPGGTKARARPQFHYAKTGAPEKDAVRVWKIVRKHCGDDTAARLKDAIRCAAYGRVRPEELQEITQCLIDAGELDGVRTANPGVSDDQLVRALQRKFNMGIDCAGYVQLAFIYAYTLTHDAVKCEADPTKLRESLGLHPRRAWENLAYLAGKPKHFDEVGFLNGRTGDLFVLGKRAGENDWHTVIVVDHTKSGKVHTFVVDASWGTDTYGVKHGGVGRRKLMYDEDTKEWWDVSPGKVEKGDTAAGIELEAGSEAFRNTVGPYNKHPVRGMFRPKQKAAPATPPATSASSDDLEHAGILSAAEDDEFAAENDDAFEEGEFALEEDELAAPDAEFADEYGNAFESAPLPFEHYADGAGESREYDVAPPGRNLVELAESALDPDWPRQSPRDHFDRVFGQAGIADPAALFLAFRNGQGREVVQGFELVLGPGAPLDGALLPGDVLLRRFPEDGYVHAAFVASGDALDLARALAQGWRLESRRPGYYVRVVEAGARPHGRAHRFARRVADPRGCVPHSHLVIRPRVPAGEALPFETPPWEQADAEVEAIRAAVRDAAVAEVLPWRDANGRVVFENARAQLGHLVRYWLATDPDVPPDVLTVLQQNATQITYDAEFFNSPRNAARFRTALQNARDGLLAGAPGTAASRRTLHQPIQSRLDVACRSFHDEQTPWSAAFVMACVRKVAIDRGLEHVTNGRHQGKDVLLKVTREGRHLDYVRAALARTSTTGLTYRAFGPTDRPVVAGDIIVMDRVESRRAQDVFRLGNLPTTGTTHGDIVAYVNRSERYALTVGGNLGDPEEADTSISPARDSVRCRRFPLDADGKLVVDVDTLFEQEKNEGGSFAALADPANLPAGRLKRASTRRIFALLSPTRVTAPSSRPAAQPRGRGTAPRPAEEDAESGAARPPVRAFLPGPVSRRVERAVRLLPYAPLFTLIAEEQRKVIRSDALPVFLLMRDLAEAIADRDVESIRRLVPRLIAASPTRSVSSATQLRLHDVVIRLVGDTIDLGLFDESRRLRKEFTAGEDWFRWGTPRTQERREQLVFEVLAERAVEQVDRTGPAAAEAGIDRLLRIFVAIARELPPYRGAASEWETLLERLAVAALEAYQVLMEAATREMESRSGATTELKRARDLVGRMAGAILPHYPEEPVLQVEVTRSDFAARPHALHLDYFRRDAKAPRVRLAPYDRANPEFKEKMLGLRRVLEIRVEQLDALETLFGHERDNAGKPTERSQENAAAIAATGNFRLDDNDAWRRFMREKLRLARARLGDDAGALGSAMSALRLYLQTFTIQTPNNVIDVGDNYLSMAFPRALTGQLIHDCGVYMVRVAYALSLVRSDLKLDVQAVFLPVHVGLIISFKNRDHPVHIVHNNVFIELDEDALADLRRRWVQSKGLMKMRFERQDLLAHLGAGHYVGGLDLPFRMATVPAVPHAASLAKRHAALWDFYTRQDLGVLRAAGGVAQPELLYLAVFASQAKIHDAHAVPLWRKGYVWWKRHENLLVAARDRYRPQRTTTLVGDASIAASNQMFRQEVRPHWQELWKLSEAWRKALVEHDQKRRAATGFMQRNPSAVAPGARLTSWGKFVLPWEVEGEFWDYLGDPSSEADRLETDAGAAFGKVVAKGNSGLLQGDVLPPWRTPYMLRPND